IKEIECLRREQSIVFYPGDLKDPFHIIIFRAEKILEIAYKQPVECIKRIQQKHIDMLVSMLVEVFAIREYPYQITLLDVRIPVLYIRIGVVQRVVPLSP